MMKLEVPINLQQKDKFQEAYKLDFKNRYIETSRHIIHE